MGLYSSGVPAWSGGGPGTSGPVAEGMEPVRVQIAAHNVEVTDAVRELVHERAGHLMRFFDGLSTVHVTLGAEKERRLAEFVAHVSHGAPLVSRAEGATLSAAIHEAAEKVETQIRRHKDRIRDHHERQGGVRQ